MSRKPAPETEMGGDSFSAPLPRRVADGLAKLGQALRNHSWHDGLPRGLTPTQGEILAYLANNKGARLQEVAESLGVRPATASEAVRTLTSKGWVVKSRSIEDARALVLDLSAEGRELAARSSRWPEMLAGTVAELETDQQENLLHSVIFMIRQLQERGAIPVARLCVTCTHFRPHAHDDPKRPHHCALVDAAFGDTDLRVDCPEQVLASEEQRQAAWRALRPLRT